MKSFNVLPASWMALTTLSFVLVTIGCGKSTTEPAKPPVAGGGVDAHPSEGPHQGSLIELGNEEYHAELVHDDAAETVTVYILDSTAKTTVPIDATELTINLTHDGAAEQFKLAASPDTGDPEGKSSRFVSSDKELCADLDEGHAEAQLVLSIDGKQFRGNVAHDHADE